MLFVSALDGDDQLIGRGSAFILEEEGKFWIHTNAHNLDGAKRIEFRDHEGRKLTKFGKFACYSVGSGEIEVSGKTPEKKYTLRYGGDGVKLELKEDRVLGFELETNNINIGEKVMTLGDNGGDGTMEILEGIVSMATKKVVLTTCETKPGSSGGALVSKDSLRVIGLNTWGVPSTLKPMDLLWSDGSLEKMYAGASRLQEASWTYLAAGDFLKGSALTTDFIDTVRLLTLIYLMTPTETGFTIDPNTLLAAELTFGDAFDRFKDNELIEPLIDLNQKLGRAKGSAISVNRMEIVKTYYKSISRIRDSYEKQQENNIKKMAPYYRIFLEKTGAHRLGDRVHKELEVAEKWFEARAKVGGSIPLKAWFYLPPLADF